MGLFVVYSCIEDKKENIAVELPVEERLELAKKYDNAGGFSEGLARVELNGKCGFIDKTGKQVIPCVYDLAWDYSEGLACVELNGKLGFIDKTGKQVIPCVYDYAWYYSEGLAHVKLNGKWGFIDKTGKQVVPCVYDDVRYFSAFDIIVAIVGESEENQVRYYYDRDGNSL